MWNSRDNMDNHKSDSEQTVSENLHKDIQLAERAGAGDRAAFETIYRQHEARIYGLCLHLSGEPGAAELLAQDTFVKSWFAIGGYRGQGPLGGWLARVATNLWRDRYRSRQRRGRLADELAADLATAGEMGPGGEATAAMSGAAGSGGDTVIPLLTAMDLERCIARLPEGARLVYVLHDVEGHTHREIAGILGVAAGTTKAQLHRSRLLLRRMLTEEN